jgi:hypothetical protein
MSNRDCLCVDAGVDPLFTELREPVRLVHADQHHPARAKLQDYVRTVFRRAHDARVDMFYPHLLGFYAEHGLRAVVGYRGAFGQTLFAEQYLDAPAEELVMARAGRAFKRADMVEVGNLALAEPGQARWVIAATTAFLAAAGYHWVLFTATRPLANAFLRLGLRPLALAAANPARLHDGRAAWGRYYNQGPAVYAGDILAGAAKLASSTRSGRPHLQALLRAASRLETPTGKACSETTVALGVQVL